MHLVQFLLPLRAPDGRPFPHAAYARVRDELTDRFGGATAFLQSPASGAWKAGSEGAQDAVQRDAVVLYEVMVPRLDRAWWGSYRQELEARFHQEAVVVRALACEAL